jgi:hypothetical protein
MHRRTILNKKGLWSDIKSAIFTGITIGVGVYLIWAFVLHGGGNTVNALKSCKSLTGSGGQCKSSCDSTLEYSLENVGCSGVNNICCIRKNENQGDVILPSGYGGDPDYDFKVLDIDFDPLPPGCSPEKNTASKTIICKPNMRYSIPVVISIRNVNKPVEVYADPVVVINGNGDMIRKPGTYTGTAQLALATKDEEGDVRTHIEVDASESKDNDYWEVYPYARCISINCRKTDSASNGILSMNVNDLVTIKFIQ